MNSQQRDTLKAIKIQVRVKKSDVRQCRLCLRVVSQADVRCVRNGVDLRRKVLDAVSIKITAFDRTTAVCINCLRLVDIIYTFQKTCRKTDLIQTHTSLMLHEGNWLNEENQESLENCQEMVRKHRSEIEKVFQYSEINYGQPNQETVRTKDDVVLESAEDLAIQADEMTDSEPEMSMECAKQLDTPVVDKKKVANGIPSHKYICEICGDLVDKTESEYHHNRHLNNKPFVCSYNECDVAFFSERARGRHEKAMHSDNGQRHECPICHKMIKKQFTLSRHMLLHKNKDHFKVPCRICGNKFYPSYIKDHMAVHTGELNYDCEKCGRKFAAKTNLTSHRRKCS
ncbi:zinc finger protein 585B-like [Malaya genurostris]|uniref:zinc finger protein 585B-like n=1 Tax=Malaya genurostris TaxID=325434 RepID=UPI0026F3A9C6|nr:zinc finger protein 585B-like [Malaya genurostris]